MLTRSIDVMLSRPGIYVVIAINHAGLVEVTSDGKCHQLIPDTGERDGELEAGGWNIKVIAAIFGPFIKAPKS